MQQDIPRRDICSHPQIEQTDLSRFRNLSWSYPDFEKSSNYYRMARKDRKKKLQQIEWHADGYPELYTYIPFAYGAWWSSPISQITTTNPSPIPLTMKPSRNIFSITLATGIGIFTSSVYPPHHSPSSSPLPVCSTCMYTRLLHIGVGENRYQNHGPCHFGVYKLRTIKARRRWGRRKNIKDLVGEGSRKSGVGGEWREEMKEGRPKSFSIMNTIKICYLRVNSLVAGTRNRAKYDKE